MTSIMNVGEVRIPNDKDFYDFKQLCEDADGWKLEYEKGTKVWTKDCEISDFKMFKVSCHLDSISAGTLYDVLHDPVFRKKWDKSMHSAFDVCRIGFNSDINYYAFAAPAPFQNRDVVSQRVWLHTDQFSVIFNHSVFHKSVPPKKNFVRAISYLSGYLVIPTGATSCLFYYITHSDPGGSLPAWAVNMMTQSMAPSMMKRLTKNAAEYTAWKSVNCPELKPWLYPEQMTLPPINWSDVLLSPDFDLLAHIDESNAKREQMTIEAHNSSESSNH